MKRYTILKSKIYEKGGGSAMSAARPYPKNYEVAPPGLFARFIKIHTQMRTFGIHIGGKNIGYVKIHSLKEIAMLAIFHTCTCL